MEQGTIKVFKLTGEKVMILKEVPANALYGVPESGYMVRMSTSLQEVFVRDFELE